MNHCVFSHEKAYLLSWQTTEIASKRILKIPRDNQNRLIIIKNHVIYWTKKKVFKALHSKSNLRTVFNMCMYSDLDWCIMHDVNNSSIKFKLKLYCHTVCDHNFTVWVNTLILDITLTTNASVRPSIVCRRALLLSHKL